MMAISMMMQYVTTGSTYSYHTIEEEDIISSTYDTTRACSSKYVYSVAKRSSSHRVSGAVLYVPLLITSCSWCVAPES